MLFLVLVTSTKHYWVVSAERRRSNLARFWASLILSLPRMFWTFGLLLTITDMVVLRRLHAKISTYYILNTSESFTRSVGVSGTYTEPAQNEIAAYKAASNAALLHALEKACRTIQGHMEGSVCQY